MALLWRIVAWAQGVPRWVWIAGGVAMLVTLLLWRTYGTGHEAGQRSRDAEVAALQADRATLQRNERDLLDKLQVQASRMVQLAAEGAQARKEAAQAENRAAESLVRVKGLRARLEAEARQADGKPAVPLTPAQKEAWNALSADL